MNLNAIHNYVGVQIVNIIFIHSTIIRLCHICMREHDKKQQIIPRKISKLQQIQNFAARTITRNFVFEFWLISMEFRLDDCDALVPIFHLYAYIQMYSWISS